jgi:hypothetical protein
MNMNEEFEAILETCIEDIAEGEASLEDCLIQYPHYAAEMEPILLTATYLHSAKDDVRPSPFLRGRIRAELKYAMNDNPQKRRIPLFFWRMALNVAVLVFALVMTNTVFAQGALPGESLYNWKLTSERIWRIVSVDPLGTDLKLSNRRLTEYVAVSNDETRRARVLTDYNELLVRFKAEEDENDRARILLVLKSQQDSLRKVGLSLPELDSYFSGGATETGGEFQIVTPESPMTRPNP